jgi:phosphoglycolate phosphatase
MHDYSYILWDFNGTLLNDVQAAIASENVLLARRNMPLIQSVDGYRETFCFPVIEYYKKLGHDFEKESYDALAHEWVEQYLAFAKDAPLNEGVLEALVFFRAGGKKQLIVSATERTMLIGQLSMLGILGYFDDVLGLGDIYGGSKAEIALEWAKSARPERALLIGDTQHDFEVAQTIGADCVLIACGHQDRKRLELCGVPVVDGIEEVLSVLG